MPEAQHAQPPPDNSTPPMTAEQRALRDMWLAELWPVCPEYRLGDRPRPYRTTI